MLECKQHPGLGLWCREDGKVLVPASGTHKEHWTYGSKNSRTGYLSVRYRGKRYYVHKLVIGAFVENCENLPTVDHINRDKTANFLSNLRYASHKTQQSNRQVCEDSLAKYGVRRCEDRNGYYRARRAKDPEYAERVRSKNREYYAKNAEHERARGRERYANNSERVLARQREYYAANPERMRTRSRKYYERQRELGRRLRKCPDGKQHWISDEEYNDRFGNESRQMQLF